MFHSFSCFSFSFPETDSCLCPMFSSQTPLGRRLWSLPITIVNFHRSFISIYERNFFYSENYHSLEQASQELGTVPITGSFQGTTGLLHNLPQALFPMKHWMRWCLGIPSNLGCCMVLRFCDSEVLFLDWRMGSDSGSTTFYGTALLDLITFWVLVFFLQLIIPNQLLTELPFPECSTSWWTTYWVHTLDRWGMCRSLHILDDCFKH